MASVDSNRVSKKYIVVSLQSFDKTATDDNGLQYGIVYGLNAWISESEDISSNPAYGPYDDIADAISYADDLNNNRIRPVSSPTYNSPTGGPGIEAGHYSDDGMTYFWGVMEIWVIDPAVDPS